MALTTPLSVESVNSPQPTITTSTNNSNNNKVISFEEEKWLNYTNLFSYFEILTLPRYAILPLVLVESLGGPKYIFFIWPLWTLVNFLIYAFFYLHNSTVVNFLSTKFPLFEKLQKYLPQPKVTFHIMWVWSILDIIFSALNFFVAIILLLFVSLDSDGTISQGWESLYASMVVECLFCALSIVIRIAMIVCIFCFLYQRSKDDTPEDNNTTNNNNDVDHIHYIEHHDQHSQQDQHEDNNSQVVHSEVGMVNQQSSTPIYISITFFSLCWIFCFLSLIFVSMTLQDFMKSKYYLTDKNTNTNNKGCDPMIKSTCLLPYPSSFYLEPSSSTPSRYQVNVPSSALPFTKRGVQIRAKYSANHYDGFAVGSMVVWALDHGQSLDNSQLNSYDNIPLSEYLNSTTLLINSRSGELHSHFSERDYIDPKNNGMGYMVPVPALFFNTSYVAVVKGLKNKHNNFLQPSDLTQQYLDAYTTSPTTIPPNLIGDSRYVRFQTIYFPLMEGIGINLTDPLDPIQIIWDFHTATHQSLTHELESARIKTNQTITTKINNHAKLYELVQEVHDNSCNGQGKMSKIDYYRVKTPWYMKNHRREKNSIRRKSLDLSMTNVELTGYPGLLLQIPCSVTKGEIPVTALVELGHGIFADRTYALGKWLRQQAGQEGWILWSMDWRGATTNDIPQFGRLLSYDFSKGVFFLQSSILQGYSDKIAGSLIVRNILQREYEHVFTNSKSIYTSSTVPGRYIGMSLGSILGAGWIAFSQIHHRAVLMAGGSSFSFLLARSDAFTLLMLLCDFQFYSRTDLRMVLQLMQASIDSFESSGWAHTGRYKDIQILSQNGLGDSTVTPIAGRILAKNTNSSIVIPTVSPEGNLLEIPAPVQNGSHLYFQVEYVHENNEISSKSKPSTPNSVHICFPERKEITSTSQLFLSNGSFVNPCGSSPCVYNKWVHCS